MQPPYISEPIHHVKVETHSPLPQQNHTYRHTQENTENGNINQQLQPTQPAVKIAKQNKQMENTNITQPEKEDN